jgi:hypothetical protein
LAAYLTGCVTKKPKDVCHLEAPKLLRDPSPKRLLKFVDHCSMTGAPSPRRSSSVIDSMSEKEVKLCSEESLLPTHAFRATLDKTFSNFLKTWRPPDLIGNRQIVVVL